MACYGYEGIDAVKEALRAGLGCSTEAMPIKVILPLEPTLNVMKLLKKKTIFICWLD